MENNYDSIPYPNFSINEYVIQKAESFCRIYLNTLAKIDMYTIKNTWNANYNHLTSPEHKVQFLTYCIGHINDVVSEHMKVCTTTNPCPCPRDSQDVIYFLYGKLNAEGIETDKNAFSQKETYANNAALNKIIYQLKELKVGQEVIYDEIEQKVIDAAIADTESLKGLQVLGKSNWFRQVGGYALEYSTTKVLDHFFQSTVTPLLKTLGNFFLLN